MSTKDDNRALPEGDADKVALDLSGGDENNALGSPQGSSFNPNLLGLDKEEGDDAPDLFAKKSSPYRGQTLFIAVVLVAGAGAIFGMRQLAVSAAKAGELFNLNFQPEAEDVELNAKFRRVMDDLEQSGRPMQVPIERIEGSPFQFALRAEQIPEPEPGEDPSLAYQREQERLRALEAERARETAAARDAEVAAALEPLELQGVLGGADPVARISGETFREGDTIAEIFTIARIEGRGVVLRVDDRYFVLQIGREPREFIPE